MKQATDDRVPTTARLAPGIHGLLERASFLYHKPKNQIIEESLTEYFQSRGLTNERYQLNITEDYVVMLELGDEPEVVEAFQRNGETPEKLRERYATKLQSPVRLVIKKEKSNERRRPQAQR